MARASLDSGSPFAAAAATPGMNGDFFADRTATNALAVHLGKFPGPTIQHLAAAQSRRQRVHRFRQLRRVNWTQLGAMTIADAQPDISRFCRCQS